MTRRTYAQQACKRMREDHGVVHSMAAPHSLSTGVQDNAAVTSTASRSRSKSAKGRFGKTHAQEMLS